MSEGYWQTDSRGRGLTIPAKQVRVEMGEPAKQTNVWNVRFNEWHMCKLVDLTRETKGFEKFNLAATRLLQLGFSPQVHVLVASNTQVKAIVFTQSQIEYRFHKNGEFYSRKLQ